MQEKRIDTLDFFRAIAAIFVVLYHYISRYDILYGHSKEPFLNFEFGSMFVSMFFILSGFLIVKTIERENNICKFLVNRLIRLWPTFVIALSITSVVLYFGGQVFVDRIPTLKQYILNLTMFPDYIGSTPVDGAYWTLPIEITFYCIMAATIIFKRKNKIKFVCILWSIISLAITVLSFATDIFVVKALKILLITDFAHLFITGMIFFIYYKEREYKEPWKYICLLIAIINQYLVFGLEYTIFYLLETIIFALTVIFGVIKIPKWLNNNAVTFVAKISYPLYLIHQMIGYVIINKIEQNGFTNEIYMIVPIAISLILAYLLNKFVELPIIKWYKQRNNKYEIKQISGKKT